MKKYVFSVAIIALALLARSRTFLATEATSEISEPENFTIKRALERWSSEEAFMEYHHDDSDETYLLALPKGRGGFIGHTEGPHSEDAERGMKSITADGTVHYDYPVPTQTTRQSEKSDKPCVREIYKTAQINANLR